MKKMDYVSYFLLALLVAGVVAFASEKNYPIEPAGFDVSSDSLMIAAPRVRSARDWVAGRLYSHGDMVRSTNNSQRVYWNVSGITNQAHGITCPDHLKGDAADGNTNVWRRIPAVPRDGIIIVNQGTNSLWLAIGFDATTNSGIWLTQGGSFWIDSDNLQDSVHAVIGSRSVSNRVTTQEY